MRKRQWNVGSLSIPPESGDEVCSMAEEKCPEHPHMFTLTPSVQGSLESRAHRVDSLKQHYRTPTSFVKFFRSYIVADGEQKMTVASHQYDAEQENAPIECVYDTCARLWGLHVPYLDPREWVTLFDYRSGLEDDSGGVFVEDCVISSMTQAFWDSAMKLVKSKLFHGDLAGNLSRNIMVKTHNDSGEIAEVKIIDFGLCHQHPGSSEDALCVFYNNVLDNILNITYG